MAKLTLSVDQKFSTKSLKTDFEEIPNTTWIWACKLLKKSSENLNHVLDNVRNSKLVMDVTSNLTKDDIKWFENEE